jgi:hypothetical protein
MEDEFSVAQFLMPQVVRAKSLVGRHFSYSG